MILKILFATLLFALSFAMPISPVLSGVIVCLFGLFMVFCAAKGCRNFIMTGKDEKEIWEHDFD